MTRALVSRPAVCPVEWIEVVLSAPVPLAVKSAIPISRSERIRAKALSAILAADLWTADAERNLVSTEARFLKSSRAKSVLTNTPNRFLYTRTRASSSSLTLRIARSSTCCASGESLDASNTTHEESIRDWGDYTVGTMAAKGNGHLIAKGGGSPA